MKRILGIVPLLFVFALSGARQDFDRMLKATTYSLSDAIGKAMKEAKEGVPIEAELEEDKGRIVYSMDIAQGTNVFAIAFDVKDGAIVEKEVEAEDHSAVAKAAKISLVQA